MDERQAQDNNEVSQSVLGDLPEVCIAMILSCLPPRDIVQLACVCRSFRAASNFDFVWYRKYEVALAEALALDPDAVRGQFTSRREIFDYLLNPIIFANRTQTLWMDRDTGGVCRSVGARGIHITWGGDLRYWDWIPDRGSLFPEVARLKGVWWYEATGEKEFSLPPGAYTFAWRIYLTDELRAWDNQIVTFTLLKNDAENSKCKCYIDRDPVVSRQVVEGFRLPTVRILETGWSEYDVGEFIVEEGEGISTLKYKMTAYETNSTCKSGLLMDGIVIRPTKLLT